MVLCDALRDIDPLPLSAGQLRQLTSRQLGDTETFHRGGNFGAIIDGGAAKHALPRVATHGHCFGDGDGCACWHGRVLQYVADIVTHTDDRLVEHRKRAFLDGQQPSNGVEQGGFSTAVWSDDRGYASGGDGEVRLGQRCHRSSRQHQLRRLCG